MAVEEVLGVHGCSRGIQQGNTCFIWSFDESGLLPEGTISGECPVNTGSHWKYFIFSLPLQEQQKWAGKHSVSSCLKLIFAKLKNKCWEKIFLFSIKTWEMNTIEVGSTIVDDGQCWHNEKWVYSVPEQIYGGNYEELWMELGSRSAIHRGRGAIWC